MRKKHVVTGMGVVAGIVLLILGLRLLDSPDNEQQSTQESKPATASFDKQKYSLSKPDSLWVVVNKQRALPSTFTPKKLRTPEVPLRGGTDSLVTDSTADSLEKLVAGASKAGHDLQMVSGYRSYSYQQAVYGSFVRQDGEAAANRYSAKPGHSEHQTGLGVDVGTTDGKCQLETCFGGTAAGKWVAANAHRYGFIIRYQKGKEAIVGYTYEPWHLRYVGKELAAELRRSGLTMEEFFNLPPAPDYN